MIIAKLWSVGLHFLPGLYVSLVALMPFFTPAFIQPWTAALPVHCRAHPECKLLLIHGKFSKAGVRGASLCLWWKYGVLACACPKQPLHLLEAPSVSPLTWHADLTHSMMCVRLRMWSARSLMATN